jgi:hypothetical protein
MTGTPVQIAVPEGTHPYWLGLLQRSGLPVRTLREGDPAAAVLFLPDAAGLASAATRALVARWRERGTPALAGPEWGKALGAPVRHRHDLGLSLRAAHGCRRLDPAPLLALPLPAAERLLRPAATLTQLREPGGLCVHEVLARADHGGLRRCVAAALRSLAFAGDRPFVHLAWTPPGFDGALAFRIDADGFRAASTAATLAALRDAGLRATWFVDCNRHERLGGLTSLAAIAADGHELQSHGHRHYTYRSAGRNEANLRRSLAVLARHGVRADAAAAPFGTWNPGFDRALRATGLRWSSEFSRLHDDVPGPLGGTVDEPWQVPVHPVCPALVFAAGGDAAAATRWFTAELRQCLARGEPAVFYAHPIDDLERCPALPAQLVAEARRVCRSLWTPTLGELHDFARRRAAAQIDVELDGELLQGDVDGPAPLVVERAGQAPVLAVGEFALPLGAATADHGPVLQPAAYRPRATGRRPLRTHRLQLARLLRELRS